MGRGESETVGIVWVYLWLSWKMVARSLRPLFVFYVINTWHHKFKASKSHYGKKNNGKRQHFFYRLEQENWF